MAPTGQLVIATRNRHKLEEIRSILGNASQCVGLDEFPSAPTVVEDQTTFEGNAAKKALELARWLCSSSCNADTPVRVVLADDSGLEVDALQGAPGIHSARFAAVDSAKVGQASCLSPHLTGNTPDEANNRKLLELLNDVPAEERTARFRCVLAFVNVTSSQPRIFEGTCEGRIDFAPHGRGGFGYDPLFVPSGYNQSFAELGEEIKNRISHRAKALRSLKEWLASCNGVS